jgi:DNA primase
VITQDTIDRIFHAAQIEEVVGDYLQLKKRGANLLGLCPFHNEKTPSFTVSPTKGIYYCFGCGRGGNAVNFLMEHESLSYPEALKQLASKYNIEVEETRVGNPDEHKQKVEQRESALATLAFAQRFFEDQLKETEDGKQIGLAYFKERGLLEKTIDTFGLGFAPDEWRALTDHATTSGITPDMLLRTGLAKVKNNAAEKDPEELTTDDLYDVFRDRVIFPIHNLSGKVIAFAGRELRKKENSPKYVNSPETEVYHKSRVLYGIHLAKRSIKNEGEVWLTEGYLDVITLNQSGIEHVVATSGTALTPDQIRLIKRFTDQVTVIYDGDAAGQKAAMRGTDLLLEGGLQVKILTLPEGEDPDSYCQKLGGQAFKEYVETHRMDFIFFKIQALIPENADPIKKASATRSILESIAKIPDAITRNFFLKETAVRLDTEEDLLFREIGKIRKGGAYKAAQKANLPVTPPTDEPKDPLESLHARERATMETLMVYADYPLPEGEGTLSAFLYHELEVDGISMEDPDAKTIFDVGLEILEEQGHLSFSDFVQHDKTSHLAARSLARQYPISESWEKDFEIVVKTPEKNAFKAAMENLLYLRVAFIDRYIDKNMQDLKSAESEEELADFQRIHLKLHEKRTELMNQIGAVILK